MQQKKNSLLENQGHALKLLGLYTAVVLLIFAIFIPFLGQKINKQQEKVAETFELQDNVHLDQKVDATPVPMSPPDPGPASHLSAAVVDIKKAAWPIKGDVIQPYGMSYSSTYSDYRFHNGIDIMAKRGSEIVTMLPGKVLKVETTKSQAKVILVDHGSGWQSMYAHLEDSLVQAGTTVKQGQVLGTVGQPGLSEVLAGPHLHFTLIKDGHEVNPLDYLP